jgi:hypothetical protein
VQFGGVVNSLKPSSKPVIFFSGIKIFSAVHPKKVVVRSPCELGLFSNF